MDYLNTDRQGAPIDVPPSDRLNLPGTWVDVVFDHDISDSAGHHSNTGGASICNGPRYCHGVLDLWLVGFELGTEMQIRSYEIDAASGQTVETHLPHEFYTSNVPPPVDGQGNELYPRTTHHRWPVMANVNTGHRLRVQVSQWPHDPATAAIGQIVKAQAQLNMWA